MKYFQHLSSTSIMLKDVLQLVLFNLLLTSAVFVLPIAKYLVLPSLTLPPSSLGRKRTESIPSIYTLIPALRLLYI